MPGEVVVLGWSVALLIVYVATQARATVGERGLAWNAGPRDDIAPPRNVYAARAQRALSNFGETYPAFVALALALAVTGRRGGIGLTGAWLWFGARVAYLPLYLFGVAWWRSAAFGSSVIGLTLMMIRLFG